MALGDIVIYRQASAGGGAGSRPMIARASAAQIQAGEPITIVAGATAVVPNQVNNLLVIAPSPYSMTGTGLLGIAQTTATNTATLPGYVEYVPTGSGTVWLINAKTSSEVDTQAEYDALVGHRVLIDLTAGVYTMLTSDSAANGCIIQPLDVVKFPGKVAFTFVDEISAQ